MVPGDSFIFLHVLFFPIEALLVVAGLLLCHFNIILVIHLFLLWVLAHLGFFLLSVSVGLFLDFVGCEFAFNLLSVLIEHVLISQVILLVLLHFLVRVIDHLWVLHLLLSLLGLFVIFTFLLLFLLLFELLSEIEQQVLASGVYLLRVNILLGLLLVGAWIDLLVLLLLQIGLVVLLLSFLDLVIF